MPKHPPLPGTLAAQAYSRIRDRILRGDLPLGAAISRRKLAEHFHMSFLPISEAIQRLERDGLVESRPRVGTRVRIPSPRDVCERQILREALEVQSARLFVEKASAEERMELRGMAARLDTLVAEAAEEPPDAEFLFRLQTYHLSFHMRVAECTGCGALCEALEKNQLLIFNWLYDTASHHRIPHRWHGELFEALAGTDPDLAEAAMRRHVRYGLEEIQAEIAARFMPATVTFQNLEAGRARSRTTAKPGAWRVKSNAK